MSASAMGDTVYGSAARDGRRRCRHIARSLKAASGRADGDAMPGSSATNAIGLSRAHTYFIAMPRLAMLMVVIIELRCGLQLLASFQPAGKETRADKRAGAGISHIDYRLSLAPSTGRLTRFSLR